MRVLEPFVTENQRRVPWLPTYYLSALGLLLFPAVCFANAGIGLLLIVAPLIVVTFPIVVTIECIFLRYKLALTWQRALTSSVLANLVSTLLGTIFALCFDFLLLAPTGSSGFEPTKIAASIALIPMFYLTIRIEYKVWRWRDPSLVERDLLRSLVVAHLLSYALLWGCVWSHQFFLTEATLPVRVRLFNQVAAFSPVQQEMEDFAAQHHRLPRPPELPRVAMDEMGRLSIVVRETVFPEGTKMFLTPQLQDDYSIKWECSMLVPEHQVIDQRYLMSNCPRERARGARKRFGTGFEAQ